MRQGTGNASEQQIVIVEDMENQKLDRGKVPRHGECAKAREMRQGTGNASEQQIVGVENMKDQKLGTEKAPRHGECVKTLGMRQDAKNASEHKDCVKVAEKFKSTDDASKMN